MDLLHERCAGVDVHKDTVVIALRLQEGAKVRKEVRTFGTVTPQLLEALAWLLANGVTHVAMEATGVYWRPVWHIFSTSLEVILANASHVKAVPGRKTDVNDAAWLADLLAHGLIRPSFVPPTPIQDLRGLMRTRKQFVRERGRHVQRLQKTLEDTNIKLASVISDITGTSGRAILRAISEGQEDPGKLLGLTTGRLKATREQLVAALTGHVRSSHRFLLKLHLDQIEAIEAKIALIDEEVGRAVEPFRQHVDHLTTMPGISDVAAQVLIAEIGTDMNIFPSAGNLISWAGMCPGNNESAGKQKKARLRKGAPWLKATIVQCAWAAVRKKDTYLRGLYYRIKARSGMMPAIVAVAAAMLNAAYHMLRDRVPYRELGPDHLERHDRERAANRLLKRLHNLGYEVAITPATSVSS
jgi:transposase